MLESGGRISTTHAAAELAIWSALLVSAVVATLVFRRLNRRHSLVLTVPVSAAIAVLTFLGAYLLLAAFYFLFYWTVLWDLVAALRLRP